jgi:type II secretory pathway pseudopilin PulG
VLLFLAYRYTEIMRIGKLTRWILMIGLIAVALIWLFVNVVQQRSQQQQLNRSIADTGQQLTILTTQHQKKIAEYSAQKDELEKNLGSFISPLPGLIAKFESPGKSIEFTEYIYEDAYKSNVAILKISTSLPKVQDYKKDNEAGGKITLLTYESTSMQITAEGEVVALLNFLDKLSTRFQSSYINQVTIKVPEERYEEEEEEEEEAITETAQLPSITINLEIYAYEDADG